MKLYNLKEITKAFMPIIKSKNTMPILRCVRITTKGNSIQIAGTNLQQTLIYKTEVDYPLDQIDIAIDLNDLKALPDEVDVKVKDNFLVCVFPDNNKTTRVKLALSNVENYPIIPPVEEGEVIELTPELKQTISLVSKATDKGNYNSVFNGVLFSKDIVATDSKRVYMGAGFKEEIEIERVIPLLATSYIDQFDELIIPTRNNVVIFKNDNWTLITATINTSFPKYQKIFPEGEGFKWLKITQELIDAVKTASPYIPSDSNKVIIETVGSTVIVSTENEDNKYASEFEQDEVYTDKKEGFNQKMILELLELFNGADLSTTQEDRVGSPIVVTQDNNKALLMPLRIKR